MKKYFVSVIISLFCISSVHSQNNNNAKGYIIHFTNDTINGIFKKNTNLYKKIAFKPLNTKEYVEYYPTDVKKFCIEEIGVYKAVKMDGTSMFLLCLVEGKVNLYKNKKNFYIEKDGVFYELEYNISLLINNEPIKDTRYMKVLLHVLNDCNGIVKKITKTSFSVKDMVKLIAYYNAEQQQETPFVVYENSYKIKIRKGFKAGFALNKVNFTNEEANYYNYDFKSKPDYTLGILLNLSRSRRFSFQSELLLTRKSAIATKQIDSYYYERTVNYSATYIELPVSMRYSISDSRLSPYLSIGIVNGLLIHENAYVSEISNYGGSENKYEIGLGIYEAGLNTGFGLSYPISENYSIEIQYAFEMMYTGLSYVKDYFFYNSHIISLSIHY